MPFNSVPYVAFLTLMVVAAVRCPPERRWVLLLAASYGFYACWHPGFALLLAGSTAFNYLAALAIAQQHSEAGRLRRLLLAVGADASLLLGFKYLNFLGTSLQAAFERAGMQLRFPTVQWLVPLGISFYTLQVVGYLCDVQRGTRPPERHLGYFALYVAFFPHIVAGPIAQSTRLLPQLREPGALDYERLGSGVRLLMWGLFLKVVIADNLGRFVDSVYGDVHSYAGFPLLIATVFFALQIYADFAGYSTIALGSARMLGYELSANFDRPYFAGSIAEFWRRWHISLSRWLSEYVCQPLSVVLRGWRTRGVVVALLATFALSGLWHGAAWAFVAWGLLQGAALAAWAVTAPQRRRLQAWLPSALHQALSVTATFSFVCFAWIFFRAETMDDALWAVRHLFALDPSTPIGVPTISRGVFLEYVTLAIVLVLADAIAPRAPRIVTRAGPALVNYATVAVLGLCLYALGVFEQQSFIYVRF